MDVSGTISRSTTWSLDTINIVGDVVVEDAVLLTVDPGVTVIAKGYYSITVNGAISAIGSEADSIKFTAENHTEGWNRFIIDSDSTSNPPSVFDYCIVEYGKPYSTYGDGGAFKIGTGTVVNLYHSDIRYNYGLNGAILVDGGKVTIANNRIHHNSSYGIILLGSSSYVVNNIIEYNGTYGIYSAYSDESEIIGNIISHNNSGGIYNYYSTAKYVNNTIVDNDGYGIYVNGSDNTGLFFYNCIIYSNQLSSVSFADDASTATFFSSDIEGVGTIYDNGGNGYVVDCWDSDPLFADNEYRLQDISPCRNSGDNTGGGATVPIYDIYGNLRIDDDVIDRGAVEGGYEVNGIHELPLVTNFVLKQNYPNPFNPSTVIGYEISASGKVVLDVFNILGQKVATLVNENKPAGVYEVRFSAAELPGGVYIYRLQFGNNSSVRKMVLLK